MTDKIRIGWEDLRPEQRQPVIPLKQPPLPTADRPAGKPYLIAAAVCGGLGFLFLLWLVTGGGTARAIERVLAQDKAVARDSLMPTEVCNQMRAIDTAGCPKDFVVAWDAHLRAWEGLGNSCAGSLGGAFANGLINGLLGSPEAVLADQAEARERWGNEINRTYRQVLEIGRAHGARIQE